MEFNQLEYLIAIAEEKTILKAADKLNISQPALTRSIKNLEEELGFQLFDRIKNRLVLNENGELAVQHAKDIIERRDVMIRSVTNLANSKKIISIGSCAPAPLWGVIQLLQTKFAKKNILSTISEDNASLIEQFSQNMFRMIILVYPIHKKNIISQHLVEEQLYLALKKDHPLANKKSITFEELDGTTIMTVSNTGYWSSLCQEQLPNSLILVQEDIVAYRALMEASNLAVLRTNLTLPYTKSREDRIYIPIEDAKLNFYCIYHEKDRTFMEEILNQANTIPWENFDTSDLL